MSLHLPPLLKRAVPLGLKKKLKAALDFIEERRFAGSLAGRRFTPPKTGPAVNYGGKAPSTGGFLHGGRVKLAHLEEAYPETDNFNILYLVSSALPPHAHVLADWAADCGAKVALNQNGVGYPGWAGPDYDEINIPMRAVMGKANYVAYQSRFCQQSADKWLMKPSCPVEVIYNCVDTDVFTPPAEPLPARPIRLLAAGSHYQDYRVISLLAAGALLLKKGLEVEIWVAGGLKWPGAEQETRKLIDNLKLDGRVKFLGGYTQNQAADIYRSCHILVHSKYNDPCPTVVIEAMACGLPVIGSASGGMGELVGDSAGALIDVPQSWERTYFPGASELASAVEKVAGNIEVLSKQSRARAVERFGKGEWLARHGAMFNRLLAG